MPVDKSKIILTFHHPRISREDQEAEGRKTFPNGHTYHIGQIVPTWREFMQALRPGDIVWVYACAMIPAPKKKVGMSLPAQFSAFMAELHKLVTPGGYLIEGATGLKTKSTAQGRKLHDDTMSYLRSGGKRIPARRKAGRPGVKWPSPEIMEAAKKIWASRNIKSDKAAIREIESVLDVKSERLIRSLGKTWRVGHSTKSRTWTK